MFIHLEVQKRDEGICKAMPSATRASTVLSARTLNKGHISTVWASHVIVSSRPTKTCLQANKGWVVSKDDC